MRVYSPSIIDNLIVSGSSSFTGSLNVQGTVSASTITGTATTAETASYVAFSNVDGLSTFSSSVDSRLDAQESFSSSLDATFATDAELSSLSSSVDTRIDAIDVEISTLQSATSSLDGRVDAIETTTASFGLRINSIESTTSSLDTRVTDLESFSSSLDTTFATDAELSALSSSVDTRLDAIDVEIGTLQSTTASLSGRVDAIETFTSSIDAQVNTLQAATSSYALKAAANTFSGHNTFSVSQSISDTTNSTAYTNGALTIAGGLGVGKDVNVSGSLTVSGLLTAVSTSFQYVTSSAYVIGTSRIFLNDDDNVRFAGVSIYDSGSASPATASILWDSLNHHFLYENISGAPYNSAIIIAGPKNTGSLGDEVELTTNRVPVASGGDHIDTDPSISPLRIDGGNFHVESDTVVTGSVSATTFSGTFAGGVVSASSQVNHDSTTGFVSDEHIDHTTVSITAGSGLTGGGTIAATRTINVGAGTGITVNADDVALTGQALALHNLSTNGIIARTGAGTVAGRTLTGTSNQVTVTNGDGVSGNPTFSLPQNINTSANVQFGGLGVGTAGAAGEVRATGEITAYYTSDRNLKTNITPLTNSLTKVLNINGVEFDWTNEHIESRGGEDGFFVRKHDVGVIAQEIEEVLPEAVANREDGTKAVRYEKIVPLLIEAIKELKAELDEVKKNCDISSN